MDKNSYTIKPLGETALLIIFGSEINPQINKKSQKLAMYIDGHPFSGFLDYVISYTSVAVYYDPFSVKKHTSNRKKNTAFIIVSDIVKKYIDAAAKLSADISRTMEIPVCYGGEYGPDIEYVAKYNNLSIDEVISIHSQPDYLVYMIGFSPGYPYMGGLDKRISTPRRSEPRLSIPVGSIGVAGMQTGCYSISTPGGWQLIGRTPIELFRPQTDDPSLLHAGDIVKFIPISPQQYNEMKGDKL